MTDAGRIALERASKRGELSFSTVATQAARWSSFASWAKKQGVGRMERIDASLVQRYGQGLAERVVAGDLSPATAQNAVGAINAVMSLANASWQSVSPTRACGIEQRSTIRQDAPGALQRSTYTAAVLQMQEKLSGRAVAVVELARELGLRSKEASLLNAKAALNQAERTAQVSITDGTKGGRARTVPITSDGQLQVLRRAADAQGEARAVMPADQSWKGWREGELRSARELVAAATGGGLHDLRAAYACERYQAVTGHAAPAAGGQIIDRAADQAARLQVALELGHGRAEVTGAYVGGRS